MKIIRDALSKAAAVSEGRQDRDRQKNIDKILYSVIKNGGLSASSASDIKHPEFWLEDGSVQISFVSSVKKLSAAMWVEMADGAVRSTEIKTLQLTGVNSREMIMYGEFLQSVGELGLRLEGKVFA